MTCDEGRVVAFVSGQLSDQAEQAFDEHLLTCEGCWRAVHEDRLGRLALDRLRVSAPTGLTDRVTLAVSLADGVRARGDDRGAHRTDDRRVGGSTVHRSRRRLLAAGALAIAVLGGALGFALQGQARGDPPQIAHVAAMAADGAGSSTALQAGERLHIDGQSLTVRSYRVEGAFVVVATSSRPFPLPADAHHLTGASSSGWMATSGRLAMYGMNRPVGRGSMFLVTAMPMRELRHVVARLPLT